MRTLVIASVFAVASAGLCIAETQTYPSRPVTMIVPLLTIVWANLHGGFLAATVIVWTAMTGHAVSGPWDPARRRVNGRWVWSR